MDVEKLIENVRRYPSLYDLSDEKYKNAELRERIWKKIAGELQVADRPAACKKKWIHVRDQFRKVLKKRKTATGMAAGTVRKYKYEDLLQFILPHMRERATLSNISLSQEEATEDDYDNREETEDDNDASNKNEEENNEPDTEVTRDEGTSARTGKIPKRNVFLTPAQNKKKKLDVSRQIDNSPSAQLMSYILEEKRNEKQQQLSSQPLHDQVHPVDAFLSDISHTLKTLNPLQLNEAKTKIFAIVQEIEKSELLESQSRAMVHHQIPPIPICQASFSGSTYPPRALGSHPTVPTHPETQALPIIYQASPAGSTYSSSSAYTSTPLSSPNYNNIFLPSTPASAHNPTDTIIPPSAEQNSQTWC